MTTRTYKAIGAKVARLAELIQATNYEFGHGNGTDCWAPCFFISFEDGPCKTLQRFKSVRAMHRYLNDQIDLYSGVVA